MAATVLGNDGTSLIFQSRTREHAKGGEKVTEVYRCAKASASSLISSGPQFGDANSEEPSGFLQTIRRDDGQAFSTLTYIYVPASLVMPGSGQAIPEGHVTSVSANALEIPISHHDDWVQGWDDTKKGVESYLSPQPTVAFTWTEDNFSWTEANVIGNVGKREKPIAGGDSEVLEGATLANWLHVGREITQIGDGAVNITDSWQYAANGWDTDIYDDA